MTATDAAAPDIVALIDAGPEQLASGQFACQVCDFTHRRKSAVGVHTKRKHVDALSLDERRRLTTYVVCQRCERSISPQHLARHQDKGCPKSGRKPKQPPKTSTEVVPVESKPRANGHRVDVTMSEALTAIVAGIRPGGSIAVDDLGRVVEWIQEGEAIVREVVE